MRFVFLNHRLLPADEAVVSVTDRGFRYGDGLFETIAVQGGVPYQFEWHMARLERGLTAIKLPFGLSLLQTECKQLLLKNAVSEGLLHIQITRGSGGRGYLPAPRTDATCVIETLPPPEIPRAPVTLFLSSYRKISPRALPVQFKLCQGLNSTLARLEADEQGCFDALLLGQEGQLCETGSGNLFWLKDNTLYTPALACGVLEGAMRAAVLRLSPYPVCEIDAPLSALQDADAVCISNVAWKILPVAALQPNAHWWDSAALAQALGRLVDADMENHCRDHKNTWA
jgi:branched-chain amino acid aminotransferase